MSKHVVKTPNNIKVRPGEGTIVDAVVTHVPGEHSSVQIDISSAPVPQKRYVADVCMVSYANEQVKIYFGQTKLASDSLRSMLVVSMSPVSVCQFLNSIKSDESDETLDVADRANRFLRLAKDMDLSLEPLANITEEPAQTAAFAVNMLLFAMSGRECCLDFYHASAFTLGAVIHTKKFALDPVVRVDLRSTIALSMIDELSKLEGKFPKDSLLRDIS